ncbi:MAG: carboxymuconolactone decarboxylase family protein [Bacteroidota bacterium]|jgi:4-carboxymuconolactone decarboxylase
MLTPRTRLITTVSSLYTVRKREKAFRAVERALRKKAYPIRFFSEIFIHLSLFLGYPAMLDGLERLAVMKRRQKFSPTTSKRQKSVAKKGEKILRRIYGKQAMKLISRLDGLENGLGTRITEDAYGAIMGRPGLPLADREVINVVILFLDGFEPQLYSHLRGALRVGVKPRTLQSVLLLAASIASKNPRTAIQILRRIAQNPKQGSF